MSDSLEGWIDRHYDHAAGAMLEGMSAVGLVKARPGFGQTIVPATGSILASPVPGAYDPDPDYFFHWCRDSAIVMEALRLLAEDGTPRPEAVGRFADFVRFSRSLQALDGRDLVADAGWRARVAPDFEQFLRTDEDLAAAHGEAIDGQTRFNPDGTLDISRWPRPQSDGPALRALTVRRWLSGRAALDPGLAEEAATLLRSDLAYTLRHWREASYDIWEEDLGLHYYTLRLQAAALGEGADWHGDGSACREASAQIMASLDRYWIEEAGLYRSRILPGGRRTAKDLDISVILAVLHAGGSGPVHSVRDAKAGTTLDRLAAHFDAAFAINGHRPDGTEPALGRYPGDAYYGGGAWYVSTLAAAEFCFRRAALPDMPRTDLLRRGNAWLAMVRAYTPASGDMSEQFDRRTGAQTSARRLGWSYAAFISCIAARRAVHDPRAERHSASGRKGG